MIEAGRAEDGLQVAEIAATAGVFTEEEVSVVEELWNAYVEQGAVASGYYFLVFRDGGQVLGFACYGPRDLAEGVYDLYWIATSIQARRRGIGRQLLDQVEEEVRRLHGRIVIVETSGTSLYKPTRDFYLGCGYEEEARIRDFYHPGDDLVIYTKHF